MKNDMGKCLKSAREKNGEKLEGVAKATGIPETSLSDYENGKSPVPVERLDTLSSHYNIPIYRNITGCPYCTNSSEKKNEDENNNITKKNSGAIQNKSEARKSMAVEGSMFLAVVLVMIIVVGVDALLDISVVNVVVNFFYKIAGVECGRKLLGICLLEVVLTVYWFLLSVKIREPQKGKRLFREWMENWG